MAARILSGSAPVWVAKSPIELAKEILELFNSGQQDQFAGYKIKIVNKFFDEKYPKN